MRNVLLVGAAALGLAAVGWTLLPRASAPPGPARPPAPDFTLPRLTGGELQLSSLRGQVVVVDFWATWCPPCRQELPWLVRQAKRFEGRGVRLLAISLDDPPGREALIHDFAREVADLESVVLLGDLSVESAWGIQSMPTLVILDREGRELTRFVGATTEEQFASLLETLTR
ncbi:MAG: TlpA family protein disulfide reductase [Myxococcota bacterium]